MSLRTALIKRAADRLTTEEALPPALLNAVRSGTIVPEQIPGMLSEYRDRTLASAVRNYKLNPDEANEISAHLDKALTKYQPDLEGQAYKATSSSGSPVSPAELGITAGSAALMPWVWGKITGSPQTIKDSMKQVPGMFGPKFLPATAGIGAAMTLLNPLRDPRVRRGEHSYWKSWKEGLDGEADSLIAAGKDAVNRYGVLGVPVQMLHGIMSPVTALYGAGRAIGRTVSGE